MNSIWCFLMVLSLTNAKSHFSLVTSGILDADVEEKFVVEGFGYTKDKNGTISVYTAIKRDFIVGKSFTLKKENNYQQIISIRIFSHLEEHVRNKLSEGHVTLQVSAKIKKEVSVYPQLLLTQGYIFTQVKEPVYTPGQKVKCRIFGVKKSLLPLSQGSTVTAEIMDPDGYMVSTKSLVLDSLGMTHNFDFVIPKVTKYGRWLIQTCFEEVCQKNYTTEFQVREYVEPTFDVKILPEKPFFHVEDMELKVKIEARYTFGKNVNGKALVRYGITEQEKKTALHWKLIQIENGRGDITICKDKLTTQGTLEHLVGRNIFVQASVMGLAAGELQEAELTSIKILKAKYTLTVIKSSSFFKPSTPYTFKVLVKNPDGSVASHVRVTSVEKKITWTYSSGDDGIATFTFNTGKELRELNVKIYTDAPMEANAVWRVLAYSSKGNYFLDIAPHLLTTRLNTNLRVDFKAYGSERTIPAVFFTYMVISKGSVVMVKKTKDNSTTNAVLLEITKEMVPSFRIVGYYYYDGEFVSDSVQIEVETGCTTPLELSVDMKSLPIPPDGKVDVKMRGEPCSLVALVAVDKAAYVNNPNNRVTSKQVFAALEAFDRTCTPGGGKDALGVFHDSGLIFAATNGNRSTDKG
uniref:complement C3-like isoform X1 n=1 Tax=Myxine glutinosa TaxID=7769 RepID=UPI00358F2090